MTIHIDVWSDFVCPWCFLVGQSLEKLRASHDVEIRWRSYELHPAGSPPISPEHLARIEAHQPILKQRAKEQYGLELHSGPFGIDSRPALIGEKYAQAQGKGDEYHQIVQSAYWLNAQDVSDLNVLKGLAAQAGLDPAAFESALADPQYEEQVNEDIAFAYQTGLSGVPALVFEEKYLISGAQPYEVLARAVDKISAELSAAQA